MHVLWLYFQEGETALSMAMRSVNPQCVLFARAVYEAALDKCNNSKSFKSKYAHSRTDQITSLLGLIGTHTFHASVVWFNTFQVASQCHLRTRGRLKAS